MSNTKYADITIVLDRSASMSSMKEAVVEKFNDFVGEMRKSPGDNRWTMVQFDDPDSARGAGEAFPQTLFEDKSEGQIPRLTLMNSGTISSREISPVEFLTRGSTALIDAICTTLERTLLRMSGREDTVKPVMLIITDGEENSSRKYTSPQLREMIAASQKKGFEFIYLGANQDAFAEASKYGIHGSLTGYGLADNAVRANDFVATADGMRMAISSGMTGVFYLASGLILSGKIGVSC